MPPSRDARSEQTPMQQGTPTDPLFDKPLIASDEPAFVRSAIEAARQGELDARGAAEALRKPELREAASRIVRQNESTRVKLETLAKRKGWDLPEQNPDRASGLPSASEARMGANFIVQQISFPRNHRRAVPCADEWQERRGVATRTSRVAARLSTEPRVAASTETLSIVSDSTALPLSAHTEDEVIFRHSTARSPTARWIPMREASRPCTNPQSSRFKRACPLRWRVPGSPGAGTTRRARVAPTASARFRPVTAACSRSSRAASATMPPIAISPAFANTPTCCSSECSPAAATWPWDSRRSKAPAAVTA